MKKTMRYLIGAFGLAWILQVLDGLLFRQGNSLAYSALLSGSMFAPLLAAAVSRPGLRQLGWRPCIRKNVGWLLAAWFLPAVLGTVGAALYFWLMPGAWDTSFAYGAALLGAEGLQQLESSGLSMPVYAGISLVSAVTYAPFINMIPALGEEVGRRGTLYPILKARFGVLRGRIFGGIIWGVWHWPIMLLAGYEYGTTYWGAPVTGPLLFCGITVAMGILFDFLYEKTDSIWVPSLCHGAINAFAGVPTFFLNPAYADKLILGPLPVGLISGLPLIAAAVAVSINRKEKMPQ